jgi:NAD(P)H dehydrogenase (quinone)
MSIVITGATGQLGKLVVDSLLDLGVDPGEVVAAGRNSETLAAHYGPKGVRTVRIDYSDPASLEAAFENGDRVLLVSGTELGQRVAQHRNVIDAAQKAGVAQLAYTSVVKADTTTLVLAPEHKATEEAVIASGLTYTLLRNGWYTENYAAALEQARQTGKVVASAGSGRIASASRSDYAAAAAAVLSTDGHDNAVYELSGDVAWDFEDLAASFGAALDRPVSYEPVEPGEHLEMLKAAGLDEQTAGVLVALDGNIRDGELAAATGDLSRLTGRPTVPLSETFVRLS